MAHCPTIFNDLRDRLDDVVDANVVRQIVNTHITTAYPGLPSKLIHKKVTKVITYWKLEQESKNREASDDRFRAKALEQLERMLAPTAKVPRTWYDEQVASIYSLLQRAQHPCTHPHAVATLDQTDALFLNSRDFGKRINDSDPYHGPMFTPREADHVAVFGNDSTSPVDDFLSHFGGQEEIPVQMASQVLKKPSASKITMSRFKSILNDPDSPHFPVNALDLRAPRTRGLRPKALESDDCYLLSDLGHAMSTTPKTSATRATRVYPQWANRDTWVLVGRGSLTSPHMDSHGLATFLTVGQGRVGFLWWSNPTEDDMAWWAQNVQINTTRGKWCYVVMRAGDTVYFPPATVQAVFRCRDRDESPSLITGGHILRYSEVGRWAKACAFQLKSDNGCVTNEEIDDLPRWIWKVAEMIARSFALDPIKTIELNRDENKDADGKEAQERWGKWANRKNLALFWAEVKTISTAMTFDNARNGTLAPSPVQLTPRRGGLASKPSSKAPTDVQLSNSSNSITTKPPLKPKRRNMDDREDVSHTKRQYAGTHRYATRSSTAAQNAAKNGDKSNNQ